MRVIKHFINRSDVIFSCYVKALIIQLFQFYKMFILNHVLTGPFEIYPIFQLINLELSREKSIVGL